MNRNRPSKSLYLALEGLNALGVGLYYTYLFWFMQTRFDFQDRHNLALSALNGLVYTICAWQGGRLGQRYGYLRVFTAGALIMSMGLLAGTALDFIPHSPHAVLFQIGVMVFWTLGVSVTWPTLEALVSDREPAETLPRIIGRYNVTWAMGWAVAYFAGGAMLEHLGPRSIFVVPLILHAVQLALIASRQPQPAPPKANLPPTTALAAANPAPTGATERARLFLRLAWIANPFAYLAITALVPVIPGLAARHALTPTWAGIFCSVWFFARLAAFFMLWHWPHWHYRFRWLLTAMLLLILSFAGILLSPSLWPIFIFQLLFGFSVGLIYYSSLYYSMDAGEAKGEHGGLHEAAIGAGLFAGPAIGCGALLLFPETPHADTWAVSATLVLGLLAMLCVCYKGRLAPKPA